MGRAVGDTKREGQAPGRRRHGRDTGGTRVRAAAFPHGVRSAARARSVAARGARGTGRGTGRGPRGGSALPPGSARTSAAQPRPASRPSGSLGQGPREQEATCGRAAPEDLGEGRGRGRPGTQRCS